MFSYDRFLIFTKLSYYFGHISSRVNLSVDENSYRHDTCKGVHLLVHPNRHQFSGQVYFIAVVMELMSFQYSSMYFLINASGSVEDLRCI